MEKTIAYCIPTYGRPDTVIAAIKGCIDALKLFNIDLYVYDSNDDGVSKEQINSLIREGYDNLFYLELPLEAGCTLKTEYMWQRYGHTKKYDYLWINKDRSYFSKEVIESVYNECQNGHDIILLKTLENIYEQRTDTDHYDNPVDFYVDWAWLVTSLDSTVIRMDTLADRCDIDSLRDIYYIDNESFFPQVYLPFYAMADMDHVSIKLLDASVGQGCFLVPYPADNRDSMLFRIWGKNWLHLNMALPAVYDEVKSEAIKRATGLYWIIGNEPRIIQLKDRGFLTDEKLDIVSDIWSQISDISWENVLKIQSGDVHFMEEVYLFYFSNIIDNGLYVYLSTYSEMMKSVVASTTNRNVILVSYLVEMYLIETDEYGESHIFENGENLNQLVQVLEILISILKIFDKSGPVNDTQINQFLKSHKFTDYGIAYLSMKENLVAEKTIPAYRQCL